MAKCNICKLCENTEAYDCYLQACSLLDGDQVDGPFPSFKEFRRQIFRMMAKGCENACEVKVEHTKCFCGLFAIYLRLKPTVSNREVVCECCKLVDCDAVGNILGMAKSQFAAIEGRVNSPIVSRMNRKINVIVNALRQLSKFAQEPCSCSKHETSFKCVCDLNLLLSSYQELVREGLIVGCAGVEQVAESKHTNVVFVDQRESVQDQGFVGGDATVSHEGISMSESKWSFISLLKRPTPIKQFVWQVDSTDMVGQLCIPGDLVKGVFVNIMDMFSYFRGSVVIRAQINGTKFHVGKLAIYYLPFPRRASEANMLSIDNITSLPHVLLDASIANSGVIKIPFSHMLSYFNTTEMDADQRLGMLYVYPYNALKTASGGTPKLCVSMWAHFEDVELHQPFSHSSLFPTGALPTAAMNVVNDVSNVARGVVSAYNLVSNLDKPLDGSTYQRYVPTAVPDITHGVGLDRSIRMALLPKADVSSIPAVLGTTDSDMSVLTLCQQQTRIATIEWKKDSPVGSVLWKCPVTPSVYTNVASGTGYDKYSVTNLAYCARAFMLWRGGFWYTLDIASSIMHSGRLAFVFVAGSYKETVTLDSVVNGGMLVCDLQEGKTFSATVPYMSTRPWMRCDKLVSASEKPSRNMATGMVYLIVLNNLAIPSGVPNSVYVNILVGAAPDFELSVPCDLTGFLSNNTTPPLDVVYKGAVVARQEVRAAIGPVIRVGPVAPILPENIEYDRDGRPRETLLPEGAKPREARVDEKLMPTVVNDNEAFRNRRFERSDWISDAPIKDARVWVDMSSGELWAYDMNLLKMKPYVASYAAENEGYHVPRKVKSRSRLLVMAREKKWKASFSFDYFHLVDPNYVKWFSFKSFTDRGLVMNHPLSVELDDLYKDLFVFLSHISVKQEIIARDTMRDILTDPILGAAGMAHVPDGRNKVQGGTLSLGENTLMKVTSFTTSENAMDLQTVLRRQYPLALMKLGIPNTDIANIPYIVIPVSPVIQRSNRVLKATVLDSTNKEVDEVIGAEGYSHVHHFAGLFSFWHGGFRYKFMFGQADNEDVSIVVVYRPNVTSSIEYGKVQYCKVENFIATMDFATVLYQGRLQASIEVEIPYTSSYNQLSLFHEISNGVYDLRSSCGVVQVYFVGIKQSLTQHVLVTAALGDDAVFSYLRAAPPIYIRKGVEQKRSVEDDAGIQDFRFGTCLYPKFVPCAAMGLMDLYTKTSDIVSALHKKLPQLESAAENVADVSSNLRGLLDSFSLSVDSAFVLLDVMAIANACVLLMRAEGYERLVHVTHIIAVIAARLGVKIVLTGILTFVSQCWDYIKGWWPQVRDTPVGAAGGAVNPFVPLCAAIVGLVCNQALPSTGLKGLCKDLVPCFRLFNDGMRTGETLVSWILPFIDVLKRYAYESVARAFPSLAVWLHMTDKIGEITVWMNDIDGIDEEYVPRLAADDPAYKNFIYKLRDKAIEYTGHIARGDDRHIASMVREYARKIIKIGNELNVMMETPSSRVDPFGICLVGESGVGKSALVPLLAHNLLDKLGYAKYNRLYARNSTDKFWSRYKGEVCVVLDDYDQHEESPAVLELVDMKTNNVFQLNHASESKKGLLFTSEVLIMTTNAEYPTRNYLTSTQAWWRRRNMLIRVIRNNLDADYESYAHLWFRLLDPEDPRGEQSEILNLHELQEIIYERARVYLDSQYELVRRNEALARGDNDVTFVDAVGASGVVFSLDMEKILAHDVYRAFDDGLFESLSCVRNGRDFVWSCNSTDDYIQQEWQWFQQMFTNVTEELRPMLKMDLNERVRTWRDQCVEWVAVKWERVKVHPGLVTLPLAISLFLAWRYYVRSQPKLFVGMTAVYNLTHHAYQQKVVFAASTKLDPQCNDLIQQRVLPYVYRIRVSSNQDVNRMYEQNCFAVGRRWIVTAKHIFSEMFNSKTGELVVQVLYGGHWMEFAVAQEKWRTLDKYDLIFLDLDVRFHEHKTNVAHFVDESDLSKLVDFDGVYVGAECAEERKVEYVRVKPLTVLKYVDPVNAREIKIYKAWKYLGAGQPSTCGGVLLANTSKIRGKLIGIHVAAGAGYGYSHVVTRQIVEMFLGQVAPCDGLVVPPVVGPLPASFPMGHFGYVGVAKLSVGAVNKTELVPSMVQGDVGPVLTSPSALSSKDPRLVLPCSPMYNAITKLGTPSVGFQQSLIDYIYKGMLPRFKLLNREKYARVLTDHEAIVGIEGLEHLDRINMATSAGYPYVKLEGARKGKLWLLDEEQRAQHPVLIERMKLREEQAALKNRIESVWIDCLKDEKRPIEKVAQGNTRLFQIPPLDFTIIFRKYFLGFVAAKMEKRQVLASQVGIDPYGPDWTKLYERLTAFSPYFFCGDYKNFDKSTLPQIMQLYARTANEFYGDEEGSDNANIRHVLVEELIHTVHIAINKVYVSHHGNPSGNPATTDLNGHVNEVYLLFAWLVAHEMNHKTTTVDEFYKKVLPIVYGDDNIIAVKRDVTDIYNPDNISKILKDNIGVVYTNAAKSGVGGDFTGIEDVVFLKNKFKDREGDAFKKWACLDKATIREMCNWVRGDMALEEMTIENVQNSCRFAYFHGREYYAEWSNRVFDALKKKDVVWTPPSFECYDLWFLSKFEEV